MKVLKQVAKRHGYTTYQLEKLYSGLTRSALDKVDESNYKNSRVGLYIALADALDITLDRLIYEIEQLIKGA